MNRNIIKDEHLATCLVNFNPQDPTWKNDSKFIEVLDRAGIPLKSHHTKQIVAYYQEKYSGKKQGKIKGTHSVLSINELLSR
jgi:hypothetical protein